MISAATPSGFLDGGLPPIRLGDTRDPRHERRAVNHRWLAATTVLAVVSAALLGGLLQAGLHRVSKLRAPDFVQVKSSGAVAIAEGRADRLRQRPAPTVQVRSPLKTRLLRSTGLGDTALTVLNADLAHMSALDRPSPPPAEDSAIPRDIAAHDESPAPAALPKLITFGSATARPTSTVAGLSAFAEPGPAGEALNVTSHAGSPPAAADHQTVIVAQRGDTIDRALGAFGISAAAIGEIATALGTGTCTGGEKIVVTQGADPAQDAGRPLRILFQRVDGATATAALADDGHYTRAVAHAPLAGAEADATRDDPTAVDDATIKENLDALAGHSGIGRPLVANAIRVLGTDRDLGAAVEAGDAIEVLYAAQPGDAQGQELDYAALTAGGEVTRLYRFAATDDNSIDYYDQAGHSLSKFLLRKPVANGRLGDGFGWRIHPVLGDRRFHEGVDYAAPYGSPVVAAGAGVVEKIDFESGYGKYIRIRHDLGYETTYAHVSGYPRGIAVGRRVQQGETIAFIGSTGLSTGPHLYYEVKINGRNVDPTRIRIAAGRILEGAALTAFQRRRDRIDTLLKASRGDAG